MAKHAHGNQSKESPEHLLPLVLPPHEMRTLYLGEFENANLIPKLTFEYEPDEPSDIDYIEDRRIMRDGAVRMRLHFQNFSAQTVTVRPRRADDAR